jgi:hypothetical protein
MVTANSVVAVAATAMRIRKASYFISATVVRLVGGTSETVRR